MCQLTAPLLTRRSLRTGGLRPLTQPPLTRHLLPLPDTFRKPDTLGSADRWSAAKRRQRALRFAPRRRASAQRSGATSVLQRLAHPRRPLKARSPLLFVRALRRGAGCGGLLRSRPRPARGAMRLPPGRLPPAARAGAENTPAFETDCEKRVARPGRERQDVRPLYL